MTSQRYIHIKPAESFAKQPELRGDERDYVLGDVAGAGGWRSQHNGDAQARGKRGAVNHEPVAGSPRAVRARRQDQAALQQAAPFAVQRRCSFMEQRKHGHPDNNQMQVVRGGMESWEPSCIEVGTLPSVGSAIEVAEDHPARGYPAPQQAPRDHYQYKDSAAQRLRLPKKASEDPRQFDPRFQRHRAGPVPTPVRANREMAVQANRESILRHDRENRRDLASSDEEENARRQRQGRQPGLRDASSAFNSGRSAMTGESCHTGMDNFSAGSILKGLQYPSQTRFRISATSQDVIGQAVRDGKGKVAVAEALTCAMNDEIEQLEHAWGIGVENDGAKSVEDRVATCLKKIVKRAEKACTLKSLTSAKASRHSDSSFAHDCTVAEGRVACAQLEADIAAKDRQVAFYKEALQKPMQPQDSAVHGAMSELAQRLSHIKSGPTDVASLGVAEITGNIDSTIEGLVGLERCCWHMFQKAQEEKSAEEERNRGFCPPATGDHQVPDNHNGAQNVLRGIL